MPFLSFFFSWKVAPLFQLMFFDSLFLVLPRHTSFSLLPLINIPGAQPFCFFLTATLFFPPYVTFRMAHFFAFPGR